MAEMKWFIEAANKLKAKGVSQISVVSETITTHEYESKTLAKAFEEITGIKVKHDIIQEGDVVEKLQTSMQSGKSIYDGWINDSDHIGTHYRYGIALSLTDQMAGAWKDYTNPGLDLKDFIGISFTTAPDGKVYQLPDQQFANLYWFRADLFARKDLQDKFKAKYGYDLGVPLNWTRLRGHRRFLHQRREDDRRPADLRPHGLRQEGSVARLALHRRLAVDGGRGRQGHPERPAGRRVGHPRRRRQVHAGGRLCRAWGRRPIRRPRSTRTTKYVEWMKKYAPKEATGMTFGESGPVPPGPAPRPGRTSLRPP